MKTHPFSIQPRQYPPKSPYCIYKNVIDSTLINLLIEMGKAQPDIQLYSEFSSKGVEGVTGYERRGLVRISFGDLLKEYRDSITSCFLAANNHYRFNLYGMLDESYINIYKRGDYLDWHHDISHSPVKLTGVIPLNDGYSSKGYTGGDFEVLGGGSWNAYNTEDLLAGDMIIFPSYTAHRVKKVTRGVRMSLGLWAIGERFK